MKFGIVIPLKATILTICSFDRLVKVYWTTVFTAWWGILQERADFIEFVALRWRNAPRTDKPILVLDRTTPTNLDRKQTIIAMITPVAKARSIWLVRKYYG